MRVSTVRNTPEDSPHVSKGQRDALYQELLARLSGIDDVRVLVEEEDFEKADRLAREFTDDLRLIFDGLGWGSPDDETFELSIPPADLRRTLNRIREHAVERYEAQRPEQEAFRATWEHTELVRDTCDEVLDRLPGG